MSASRQPALEATARELLALLEEHQGAVSRMVAAWPERVAYEQVSAQLDRLCTLCGALTGSNIAWAKLLIVHAELVQALCRLSQGSAADEAALAQASDAHARAVARLQADLSWRGMRAIRA